MRTDRLAEIKSLFRKSRVRIAALNSHRWAAGVPAAAALASCQSAPPLTPDTPVKTYERDVMARTRATWIRLATARINELAVGQAKISFRILATGRLSQLQVATNTGNDVLAEIARQTALQTHFPPIPVAVMAALSEGYMPGDIVFTTYEKR